ncbi:pyrimidine/purine nucleoside phosphorylase [Luteolibacter yonseiensis]|uniref:Pyrimidine/purine nucleoside phosphorylase n=1 Tax=Luteolibacter yonseiensis TaxID=1144680 RepID=A0A934VCN1_9BACT|nr:pyrimidine/purine nucleoside phosphorylase [Luteolibacter yonseiensis]MBK1817146.1 pyrimidine/purine nucleoside phosphorylase [Luteolibacter yonseiensis]
MSSSFSNVTVDAKANVYFDGSVVSHTVHFADGTKKTLGLIYPGNFHFGTAAPERMEIIAGSCEVILDGTTDVLAVEAGSAFDVPGNSGFNIKVVDGICEYICSFLPA